VLYDKAQSSLLWCPPGKIGEVIVPDSVTTVEYDAFVDCTLVHRVVLGASVSTLHPAFAGCTGLTSVFIGQSVTLPPESLLQHIFESSDQLATIDVHPLNSSFSSVDGVLYDKAQSSLLWCPPGKIGEVIVPDSVTTVEYDAFVDCTLVLRVVLGASVSTLHPAFAGCTGLTSVFIGQSVTLPPGVPVQHIFESSHLLATIDVHPLNSSFSSVDGVLYDKAQSSLLWCPPTWSGALTVPATVTSIESFGWPPSAGVSALYFLGDAPPTDWMFPAGSGARVYFLPDASGWQPTFAGLRTAFWVPAVAAASVRRDPVTGEFSFAIQWEGDRQVVVEATSSLTATDWEPVGIVTLHDGAGTFYDAPSPAATTRFYRVRQP